MIAAAATYGMAALLVYAGYGAATIFVTDAGGLTVFGAVVAWLVGSFVGMGALTLLARDNAPCNPV